MIPDARQETDTPTDTSAGKQEARDRHTQTDIRAGKQADSIAYAHAVSHMNDWKLQSTPFLYDRCTVLSVQLGTSLGFSSVCTINLLSRTGLTCSVAMSIGIVFQICGEYQFHRMFARRTEDGRTQWRLACVEGGEVEGGEVESGEPEGGEGERVVGRWREG